MKIRIKSIAKIKFKQLRKKYNKFINVGVDNWRGFRFIYDTEDVQKCNNKCQKCELFNLLKNEKNEIFSTTLYPADEKDKRIFGNQNYLNCKTLKQYANCYIKFLLLECQTKKEIKKELNLVNGFRLIFAKSNKTLKENEKIFKTNVILKTLKFADKKKRENIERILAEWKENK